MLTFHYLTLNEKLGKYELSPALKKTDWNVQAKPYYVFTAHTGITLLLCWMCGNGRQRNKKKPPFRHKKTNVKPLLASLRTSDIITLQYAAFHLFIQFQIILFQLQQVSGILMSPVQYSVSF